MNARSVFQNFADEFTYMKQHNEWGVLTYTFHPHVVGRGQRMLALEGFVETLRHEGARFVTMEAAVAAYRSRYPDGISLRG